MDEVLLIAAHVLGLLTGAYCMWVYMSHKVRDALASGLEAHKIAEDTLKLLKEVAGPGEPVEIELKTERRLYPVNVFKTSGRWN